MAEILLLPFGSAGDVFPFIWLGRQLMARGHRVRMITACLFEDQARKAGQEVWLLDDYSWNVHADQYIRNALVLGDPLKVRVEVKTRSRAAAVVREYPLPFGLQA